jgi:hypothetical protein
MNLKLRTWNHESKPWIWNQEPEPRTWNHESDQEAEIMNLIMNLIKNLIKNLNEELETKNLNREPEWRTWTINKEIGSIDTIKIRGQ